jgi:hypothetical protein
MPFGRWHARLAAGGQFALGGVTNPLRRGLQHWMSMQALTVHRKFAKVRKSNVKAR